MNNLLEKTQSARNKILKLSEEQDRIFESLLDQISTHKNLSISDEQIIFDYCFNETSFVEEKINQILN